LRAALEPANRVAPDSVLQRLFLRCGKRRGAQGTPLHRTLRDMGQQGIGPDGTVRDQFHVIVRMAVGRIRAASDFRPQAVGAGGDGQGLQQCAVCDLAGVAVEVVDAVLAGVEAVDDETMVVDHLEAPGLGVVTGRRPAGEFEDFGDGLGERLHL